MGTFGFRLKAGGIIGSVLDPVEASINLALAIAIYAAAVSTAVGGWQVFAWWWQRRTRIEVDPFRSVSRDHRLERTFDHVLVKVVNRSDHGVRLMGLTWCQKGSRATRSPLEYLDGSKLPLVIGPRDSCLLGVEAEFLRGFDLTEPVIVAARLSAGGHADSKPTMLHRRGWPPGAGPFAGDEDAP
jgi:hypothetical protein